MMPSDIVQVPNISGWLTWCTLWALTWYQSHTDLEMATVFASILEDLGLAEKVLLNSNLSANWMLESTPRYWVWCVTMQWITMSWSKSSVHSKISLLTLQAIHAVLFILWASLPSYWSANSMERMQPSKKKLSWLDWQRSCLRKKAWFRLRMMVMMKLCWRLTTMRDEWNRMDDLSEVARIEVETLIHGLQDQNHW